MFDKYYKKFLYLHLNFDLEMSLNIFGNVMGTHLYEKWLFYDQNIIEFIYNLDDENTQKLFEYLLNLDN
jgi:hypothetical protein